MNPTLLVMAAGMGSRFGGLKQVAAVGPNGATLLDYSLYNALAAGFDRVVFVIRQDMAEDFKEAVGTKWEPKTKVRYVYQELGMLPLDIRVPEERKKPWGTAHAVLVAQDAVPGPFAVINADDYYGPKAFGALGKFLQKADPKGMDFAMVGYALKNTLSPHGSVSRGLCRVTPGGLLKNVEEHSGIAVKGKALEGLDCKGKKKRLTGKETVSMNLWGFTPGIFGALDKALVAFLKKKAKDPKAECYLPTVVDDLIQKKKAKVQVISTGDAWYGLTNPEDKMYVYEQMHKLVFKKVYPEKLW
jgi:dTDP-glucose pyrophosphorylase